MLNLFFRPEKTV